MIPSEWLDAALSRISPHVRRTPLTFDAARGIYFKWDNQQVTGSFKARGALNKVLALEPWERELGLVTASAGNHGQGMALAGQLSGAQVTVFTSEGAPAVKVEAMRSLGAEVRLVPGGYAEAEAAGLAHAAETQKTWVSAYNDGQVVAGQGTLALEILDELADDIPQTWLVPVSGGGLISGVGAALQRLSPRPKLIGVQAEASPFMHALFRRGSQENVPDLPSLADGLTGAVEAGSITIPLVQKFVDEIILVSEDEIARAVAFAWREYGQKIEGSGAVGLAALLGGKVKTRPVLVVVSGGNIQPEVHAQICRRFAGGQRA
ncbi:MAG: threonine/serine dehydratase [Chloroflexota bacterium]